MKVAITGASGFIGARLAVVSRQRGHEVTALGRLNNRIEMERAAVLTEAGISFAEVDVGDRVALERAFEGAHVVFHLAAAQHEANVGDDHFHRVNVDGTRNVLEAAVTSGVRRLVHGSTIGVYGSAAAGELSEASPTRPDNIYGITKLAGEELVMSFKDRLPVTVIRISETYGPGDSRLLKLFQAIKKKRFFIIGSGRNVRQLIYVDDLIDGMYRAAEREAAAGEVFVLAGEEILTTRQTAETIAAALGVGLLPVRAPLWPFLALAVVMEKTMAPLGVQPPLHRRRLDFFRKSFFFSLDKAAEKLGFKPRTSFAEGAALSARAYEVAGRL